MAYKWCVVPKCTNTSINSPNKLFVSVPTNQRRKLWLQLAGRDPNSIVLHSNVFMCEDHFDMEKDTKNLMKYKMGFCQKLFLTDEAVPSKFSCQESGKRRLSDTEYSGMFHAESLQKVIKSEDQIVQRKFFKNTAVPSCNLPIDILIYQNNRRRHSEKIITPPSNLDMNEIVIKNQVIEVDTETNFSTNTKIQSHKIIENDIILSNQDLKDPLFIEYKDIKTELEDTEFINKNENEIIEELKHSEIIIKEENIKIEQELHTVVIIKEETEESD